MPPNRRHRLLKALPRFDNAAEAEIGFIRSSLPMSPVGDGRRNPGRFQYVAEEANRLLMRAALRRLCARLLANEGGDGFG